jgi:putative copper resistance protein D
VDELIVASRLVHYAAVAFLFGAPLFRLAVAREHAPQGRVWELAASVAALLSGLGWFAGVAATMAGSFAAAAAPDNLQAVTFDTRFGHLWIGRLIVLVAIFAVQLGWWPSRRRDGVLVLLAAGFAASLVGVGHGMTGAGHGPAVARIHMVADMVHLLCAAAWIGGLFCLGPLLHRVVTGSETSETARRALRRFSTMGYWAVALVLITGCINALVMVPRPASLIGSDYGRALLLKLALVVVLVVMAIINRVVLTPPIMAASDAAGIRRLWHNVVAEQVVGIVVLAVVAWLGTIHPVP